MTIPFDLRKRQFRTRIFFWENSTVTLPLTLNVLNIREEKKSIL